LNLYLPVGIETIIFCNNEDFGSCLCNLLKKDGGNENMNIRKIGIVLLALLVTGMAIVPMVCAVTEPSAAVPQVTAIPGQSDPASDPAIRVILNNASTQETLPISISGQIGTDGIALTPKFDAKSQSFLETYVSPSDQLINTMKARHYSEAQITDILNKNGYGWEPKTGASWKGTAPTPAEQKIISQIRGPGYSPFPVQPQNRKAVSLAWNGRAGGATQYVTDENAFVGFNGYMLPGSMTVSSTGTFQHVVTTHVGKKTPSGKDDWTEAGVSNSMNDPYARYFTYDNDEGGWQFLPGPADIGWFKNYAIYVSSTHDSSGYVYNTWINNNWVRSGHLKARQTGINNANEIWSVGSNWFSHDSTNPTFQSESLYTSTGSLQWGDHPNTATLLSSDPYGYVLKDHTPIGGYWKFFSWNV
jgi:hypothetical protein